VDRETLIAPGIDVKVDTTKMMQNKIAQSICTLDWEGVGIPYIHEPGIFDGEEVSSRLIGPYLDNESVEPKSSQFLRYEAKHSQVHGTFHNV
jgi:hypothetical protein